jgi:hypothetical protein
VRAYRADDVMARIAADRFALMQRSAGGLPKA